MPPHQQTKTNNPHTLLDSPRKLHRDVSSGAGRLVYLVGLVCLVCFVCLVGLLREQEKPDQLEEPDKPDKPICGMVGMKRQMKVTRRTVRPAGSFPVT